MKSLKKFLWLALIVVPIACSQDEEPLRSSAKQIKSFRFEGIDNNGITVDISGAIDEQNKAIAVEMPSGTDVTALEPEVEFSAQASVEPTGPQDFSKPINYTVTAEDGTSKTYLVTVEVALSQKEILLRISQANPGNLLNWNQEDNLSDWKEVILDGSGNVVEIYLGIKLLTVLPPEIGRLHSLQVLKLNNNHLSALPAEIGQLTSLKELHLGYNRLAALPAEIWQLGGLEVFDLQVNQLSTLPVDIGQLGALRVLKLYNNNLSTIPAEIGQLGNLEQLTLSQNNLTSIPPEIGQLGNLKYLSLYQNNLSAIPTEIGQLTSLNHLSLLENALTTLPSSIGQLIGLTHLDLRHNDLIAVPSSIGQLTNLSSLYLAGNSIISISASICDLETNGNTDIDVVPGILCGK